MLNVEGAQRHIQTYGQFANQSVQKAQAMGQMAVGEAGQASMTILGGGPDNGKTPDQILDLSGFLPAGAACEQFHHDEPRYGELRSALGGQPFDRRSRSAHDIHQHICIQETHALPAMTCFGAGPQFPRKF